MGTLSASQRRANFRRLRFKSISLTAYSFSAGAARVPAPAERAHLSLSVPAGFAGGKDKIS